jgi:predicted enzyme related to lactoylglutathione lyase
MRADGKIDYCEFSGRDIPAMKRFYAQAFGWGFTDYGPTYVAFEEAGLDGGISAEPESANKPPLVVLYATDIEAMFARVKAAGGAITKDIFSFPGGRRFQFRDPSGNELAVWSEA